MKNQDRYKTSYLSEAQYEPGSRNRVLKNLLGIKRKREMDQAESEALERITDMLFKTYDKDHRFKEANIKDMHKTWLKYIYDWAGEYRNVNLSKGDFPFAAANQLPQLMNKFEKDILIKHTPCNFKTLNRVIQALAIVHTELVLIHPFREGNGRITRVLATLMATQARLPLLDFSEIKGKKKEEYFTAVQAGMDKDYKPMEAIFELIIRKTVKDQER